MNAYRHFEQSTHRLHDLCHFGRKGSPVGITKNQRIGATLDGRLKRLDSVFRIVLVAIKEVLSVVYDLFPPRFEESYGIADHPQVFLQRRVNDVGHMEIPTLAKYDDNWSLGKQ